MAKNKPNQKTSLEKSHSKWSNAKLTMLCTISTFSVSALWIILGLRNVLLPANKLIFVLLVAVSGLTFLVTILLFDKFKR